MADMRKHHENHRKSSHRIDIFNPLFYHSACKNTKKLEILAVYSYLFNYCNNNYRKHDNHFYDNIFGYIEINLYICSKIANQKGNKQDEKSIRYKRLCGARLFL